MSDLKESTKDRQDIVAVEDEIDLREIVKKLIVFIRKAYDNKIKIIIGVSIISLLAAGYLFFLAEEKYEASISVLPETQKTALSNLGTLAALSGLQSEGGSTEIYERMLKSDYVLQKVVYAKFYSQKYQDSLNLLDYFKIDRPKNFPEELSERARYVIFKSSFLQNILLTEVEKSTKILKIVVTMPEAKLAADVANKFGEALDEFVRLRRKSQASEQRYYIEKRLSEVKDSLTVAEEEYKQFRERNRNIVNSPQLLLEEGRYRRRIEIMQAVFIELNKQREIAKIDEIKDAPIVRIMEKANNPVFRSAPKRIKSLFVVFILSSVLISLFFGLKDNIYNALLYIKNNFKESKAHI
jgi:uncharacterized protein involved in exopolysaccharide biosynthesis